MNSFKVGDVVAYAATDGGEMLLRGVILKVTGPLYTVMGQSLDGGRVASIVYVTKECLSEVDSIGNIVAPLSLRDKIELIADSGDTRPNNVKLDGHSTEEINLMILSLMADRVITVDGAGNLVTNLYF